MKRGIIFLTALCSLLLIVVTSEYFYSKNLKKNTEKIIETCEDSHNDDRFIKCADDLNELMKNRRFINRMFYSKDIAERIISEIEKLNIYAMGDNISDTKAQLESIKFSFETLYRFNANEG